METKRMAKYGAPRYPAKTALPLDVYREMPNRWQKNAAIAAAIAGATALAGFVRSEQGRQVLPGDMAPIRVLNESEARRILIAEGRKLHLTLSALAPTVAVELPPTGNEPKRVVKYRLTAWDKKHRVGFVYVSDAGVEARLGRAGTLLTVQQMPTYVRNAVAKAHLGGRVRVIAEKQGYDAETRRQLRREIRSFVQWLKSQGVI